MDRKTTVLVAAHFKRYCDPSLCRVDTIPQCDRQTDWRSPRLRYRQTDGRQTDDNRAIDDHSIAVARQPARPLKILKLAANASTQTNTQDLWSYVAELHLMSMSRNPISEKFRGKIGSFNICNLLYHKFATVRSHQSGRHYQFVYKFCVGNVINTLLAVWLGMLMS